MPCPNGHLAGCSDRCIGGAAGSTDSTVQGGLLVQELHSTVHSLKGAEPLPAWQADQMLPCRYTDRQQEQQLDAMLSVPENAQCLAPQPAYQYKLPALWLLTDDVQHRNPSSWSNVAAMPQAYHFMSNRLATDLHTCHAGAAQAS